jgi:hypothetical protein
LSLALPTHSEPEFLRKLSRTKDWYKLFVRNSTDGQIPDSAYLENMTAAMRIFDKWFRGETSATFEQMTRASHVIAAHGKDLKSNYLLRRFAGYTRGESNELATEAVPLLQVRVEELERLIGFKANPTGNVIPWKPPVFGKLPHRKSVNLHLVGAVWRYRNASLFQ